MLGTWKLNVYPIVHFNRENINIQYSKWFFVSCINTWHMELRMNWLYPFLYMQNEWLVNLWCLQFGNWSVWNIMILIKQCSSCTFQLQILRRVTSFCSYVILMSFIQGFTHVVYWMDHLIFLLTQHSLYCNISGVTHQFKRLWPIKSDENRYWSQSVFQCLEYLVALFIKDIKLVGAQKVA